MGGEQDNRNSWTSGKQRSNGSFLPERPEAKEEMTSEGKGKLTAKIEESEGRHWPRLLSVELAAEYLSLSPRTIYNRNVKNAVNPFPVKPKKWGKRVLFDIRDLDRWADTLDSDSNGGAKTA